MPALFVSWFGIVVATIINRNQQIPGNAFVHGLTASASTMYFQEEAVSEEIPDNSTRRNA